MLLIATDEAGYGPKLGPLVICATAWSIPDSIATPTVDPSSGDLTGIHVDYHDVLHAAFEPLRKPSSVGNATVIVDDSKSIFKPKTSSRSRTKQAKLPGRYDPIEKLHAIVSVANQWFGGPTKLADWMKEISPADFGDLVRSPWLSSIQEREFVGGEDVDRVLSTWQTTGIELLDVKARTLPAAKFNEACGKGMNKADLLSEGSLGLVRDLVDALADRVDFAAKPAIRVFCDRHGGRRYYAGVLQHIFPKACVQVASETKHCSAYRVVLDADASQPVECSVEFTVKGDTFSPVAMSSIFAKYIRERMMQTFNEFFNQRFSEHCERTSGGQQITLRPTAGYPSDADRFLADIAPVIESGGIELDQLVRQR